MADFNAQGQFNQASFLQIRLHELYTEINILSSNSGAWNNEKQTYNYNIIFNDLISVFSTISAKLKPDEKEEVLKKQEVIENLLVNNPPNQKLINPNNPKKSIPMNCPRALFKLNKLLQDFKMSLEALSDKHGLGNPTKDDPRLAGARR